MLFRSSLRHAYSDAPSARQTQAQSKHSTSSGSPRKMVFEARKVVAARPDISPSAADVLKEPVVVCRASGTCVVKKEDQRIPESR